MLTKDKMMMKSSRAGSLMILTLVKTFRQTITVANAVNTQMTTTSSGPLFSIPPAGPATVFMITKIFSGNVIDAARRDVLCTSSLNVETIGGSQREND